ncbi:MAG: hypothetical protein AAF236_06775 [Verrucomicrobiota bacterium]
MPQPDTATFYACLFGTTVLIPILLVFALFSALRLVGRRSIASFLLLSFSSILLIAAVLINPVSNCLLFVSSSNARVAEMHEKATREGFVGKSLQEFASRFGQPNYRHGPRSGDYNLSVYTCRPWFAYGWDELVVHTRDDLIVGIFIDD